MRERIGGNTKIFGGRKVTALAVRIEQELREIIPRITAQQSAKVIAFHAGSVPRSAENWQQGVCLPQAPHLIVLARQFPELRTRLLEWLDASTGDSGDDPSRVLNEIATLLGRRMR